MLSTLKQRFQKRREHGQKAEHLACDYLKNKGLTLITKNYRCKQGEVDLIMQDHQTIVFVEVRYRSQNTFGSSLESVNHQKQKKIILCASYFLQNHPDYRTMACRFDVVALYPNVENPAQWSIDWIVHAFDTSAS